MKDGSGAARKAGLRIAGGPAFPICLMAAALWMASLAHAAEGAAAGGKARPPSQVKADSAAPRITASQKDFCTLVWGCGLPEPAGYCPGRSAIEMPGFAYDSARCREARLLNSRGVTPAHPLVGFRLYRFLGMEYRVIYAIEDELPISEARLAYLLGDLPLAARLISHFIKEPYSVEYLDAQRKQFKGSKGKRLRGDATLISGSSEEKRLFYFGYGVAAVAWWTLKGPALMDFSYAAAPGRPGTIKYKISLLVFPGNGVVNSIMNLGMFRKVVLGKVREVLGDITATARKLADGGSAEILSSKSWSAEEKRKIEAFLKLP